MTIRNLTWQQVAVLVACLAATFAAYKLLGPEAGGVSSVVSAVLAFLLGRDPPPPPAPEAPPALKLVPALVAVAALAAWSCGAHMTANERYTVEQTACASTSPTLAASRACRADVDRRFGVDGGAR
jgi:hypothetical protein